MDDNIPEQEAQRAASRSNPETGVSKNGDSSANHDYTVQCMREGLTQLLTVSRRVLGFGFGNVYLFSNSLRVKYAE